MDIHYFLSNLIVLEYENISQTIPDISGVGSKLLSRPGELEARRVEPGAPGSWRLGLPPLHHQLGGLWERCKFPQWVRGEAPAAKNFGAFWVL